MLANRRVCLAFIYLFISHATEIFSVPKRGIFALPKFVRYQNKSGLQKKKNLFPLSMLWTAQDCWCISYTNQSAPKEFITSLERVPFVWKWLSFPFLSAANVDRQTSTGKYTFSPAELSSERGEKEVLADSKQPKAPPSTKLHVSYCATRARRREKNGGRRYIKHDETIASSVGFCLCCWQLHASGPRWAQVLFHSDRFARFSWGLAFMWLAMSIKLPRSMLKSQGRAKGRLNRSLLLMTNFAAVDCDIKGNEQLLSPSSANLYSAHGRRLRLHQTWSLVL